MSSPSGDRSTNPPHFAVILAGGSGTRLWPLSRNARPKQLAHILGDGSLLQQTAQRVLAWLPPTQVVTVTQREQEFETRRQLEKISPVLGEHLLIEPTGRNTLPAIAWAVLEISKTHPDAIVSVFPSDHRIGDLEAFQGAWKQSLVAAKDGFLTTFGIQPTEPETGYGYIEAGEPTSIPGVLKVKSFVEKPDRAKALEYVTSGRYFWNSGMFSFTAATFLEELKNWQPSLHEAMQNLSDYASLPSISIDYGLMEKSSRVAVVPASFDWSDLGSWEAVYRASKKDANSNVMRGNVVVDETQSSLLISEQSLLATIGLKDVAVIQSGDAILVADLAQSQKIKTVLEEIRKSQKGSSDKWIPVTRPWGTYTVIEEGPHFKIKKIVVNPGQKLSLQRHSHRAEHWVVIQGVAKVTCGDKTFEMKENESTFIPQGEQHRLENPGPTPLLIVEVQTGSYLGEDDIQRFDDVYGRK